MEITQSIIDKVCSLNAYRANILKTEDHGDCIRFMLKENYFGVSTMQRDIVNGLRLKLDFGKFFHESMIEWKYGYYLLPISAIEDFLESRSCDLFSPDYAIAYYIEPPKVPDLIMQEWTGLDIDHTPDPNPEEPEPDPEPEPENKNESMPGTSGKNKRRRSADEISKEMMEESEHAATVGRKVTKDTSRFETKRTEAAMKSHQDFRRSLGNLLSSNSED